MEKRNSPPTLASALRNEGLCRAFYCFLKETKQEKHLTFWLEAEDYRHLSNSDRETRSVQIYESFFSSESPSYLNLDYEAEELWESVQYYSDDCFEHTQHSSLLYLSSFFESFLESEIYSLYIAEQTGM